MAYLVIMSHIINPIQEEGGQTESRVSDDNVQQLLTQILKELKIMNLHLSIINDDFINREEIPEN